MNYYERHLGDYAKDTAHLSMMEHGAYTLLLDRYYSTEKGIPEDQAHRVARARSKEERAAVDAVLAEFFTLSDGVWINRRAEEEIPLATARINAARVNGKKGGRPKGSKSGTQEKPNGLSLGSENETQTKAHQTPDTSISSLRSEIHTKHQDTQGGASSTEFGRVSALLRSAGVGDAGPGNAKFRDLVEAQVSDAEWLSGAEVALSKGKGFVYLLGVVEGRRRDVAETATGIHRGPIPQQQRPAETAWQRSQRERVEEATGGLLTSRKQSPIDQTTDTTNAIAITLG